MRNIHFMALLVLVAAPVQASPDRDPVRRGGGDVVDRLYPEIDVAGESWRGLLPVILLDTEAVGEKPADTRRSERAEPQPN